MNSIDNQGHGKSRRSGTGTFDIPKSLSMFRAPYPGQYERKLYTRDGTPVSLRPIKPEDGPLLVDFFDSLSPQTVYSRFLCYLKSLSKEWVERFTRIDYDRDVAMVAVEATDSGEKFLGACWIMRDPGSMRGEIAVVVRDSRQRRGIGAVLLEESIRIARKLGMKSLWALVSHDNTTALTLAGKLGFTPRGGSGADGLELEMTLHPSPWLDRFKRGAKRCWSNIG